MTSYQASIFPHRSVTYNTRNELSPENESLEMAVSRFRCNSLAKKHFQFYKQLIIINMYLLIACSPLI